MTPLDRSDLPYHPDQDKGCLRWVMGVPLVILHLLSAGLLLAAFVTRPGGDWDDGAYAGIAAACLTVFACSGLALAVTLVPSVRRTMGPWWLAPPVAMILLGALRMATV
ncbi:hypothetical protein ACFU5O_09185 [Streptomyces sp. NPDC057445]|uniref:hypothetical protein n=1 Tax=Streptomyces sp. NPDC057445 TaxID=3346136 RepID=UPI00369B3E13